MVAPRTNKGWVGVLLVLFVVTGSLYAMYSTLDSGPSRTTDHAEIQPSRIWLGRNTEAKETQKNLTNPDRNTEQKDINMALLGPGRNTNMGAIQEARLRKVREVCSAKPSIKDNEYYHRNIHKYMFSTTFNLSICTLPKSGTTFLSRVIFFLENKGINASTVFSKPHQNRPNLRGKGGPILPMRHGFPVILMTRDQYTRLFSCYIDRVYLSQTIVPFVRSKTSHCYDPVSFQDFLDYIFEQFEAGKKLNIHFTPVYHFCRPCEDDVRIVLKQETYSSDLEYILEVFGVDTQKKEEITKALHKKRSEYTTSSLVAQFGTRSNELRCIGAKGVAKKLWTSFQIQGYINDTVPFPDDIDASRWRDVSFAKDVIIQTMAAHPMSEDQQKAQRRAALVTAYHGVRQDTIEQIRRHYKTDFELLGYDMELPKTDLK